MADKTTKLLLKQTDFHELYNKYALTRMTNLIRLIITILFGSAILPVLAIPAKRGVLTSTQPDGTLINICIYGDEFNHYATTEDGYLLTSDDEGFYVYATVDNDGTLTPTTIKAENIANRSSLATAFLANIDAPNDIKRFQSRSIVSPSRTRAFIQNHSRSIRKESDVQGYPQGPGLFPDSSYPVIGKQKGLVILVQYADVSFKLDDPKDYFERMLNEEDFSDYGGTGSARDYFLFQSGGLFDVEFDVYGPVTLPEKRSYYGANDSYGDDKRPEKMVIHACQLLDKELDFNEYDRDDDGVIDNVYIFYAGAGEASGGSADTIWPHSWYVTDAGSTVYFDELLLDRYACSNEWESNRPDGVGTFIHEFSHVMGLPDLYDTEYSAGTFTPDSWSALDYGPYNNNGCTPPNYGAFERYALGWMAPTVLSGDMNVELPEIANNEACIIRTSSDNEFYLLENRQQNGWDKYIPGHGMLIWHIDYNADVWNYNTVNNSASHQYVDIVEADNTRTKSSRAGDAFPGTSNVTEFTSTTTPALKTWKGVAINTPITEIAETNGIITFIVGEGIKLGEIVALPASDITDNSFTANWEAVNNATDYLLTVYTKVADGDCVDTCDFGSESSINLPDSWSSSSYSSYIASSYSGKAIPSLRLGSEGDYLRTPSYSEDIHSLSFWHRGASTSDDDIIRIIATSSEGISTAIDSITIIRTVGGTTTTINTIPENTRRITFEYTRPTGNSGGVAIDDIVINYGTNIISVPIDGYDVYNTGNVTSHTVYGLQPGTEYFYTLIATDGELFTGISNEISVTTTSESAIPEYSSVKTSIKVNGLLVHLCGLPADAQIYATNITGKVVATAIANEGMATIKLPTSGVYILYGSTMQPIKVVATNSQR